MTHTNIKLIEKIEGEAKLHFHFEDKKISHTEIEFLATRNIEKILEGKSGFDALVINPRVCGICGHAHLMATVMALEDCYQNLKISKKAKIIRELTLNFELIQNHFKWFYLTILPLFGHKQYLLKATTPSQLMGKAIAIFGGQYPHTSYALVGGVACDPTFSDILKVEKFIDETISFYEQNVIQVATEDFLVCTSSEKVLKALGDMPLILNQIKSNHWEYLGQSYDRFIVFGGNSYFASGKANKTRMDSVVEIRHINEYLNSNSFAKNVTYKDKFYETGPLSRAILNKTPLIKDAHRRYKDSIFSRILARVCEIPQLLNHTKKLLKELDLSEESYIKPKIELKNVSGFGQSAVEAARGTLCHKVHLDKGIIKKYEIITPTQWNLSNGTKDNPAISQKAMVGLEDEKIAEIVFKSFDVCSVCTTH